jgi:hypothetical protein
VPPEGSAQPTVVRATAPTTMAASRFLNLMTDSSLPDGPHLTVDGC